MTVDEPGSLFESEQAHAAAVLRALAHGCQIESYAVVADHQTQVPVGGAEIDVHVACRRVPSHIR